MKWPSAVLSATTAASARDLSSVVSIAASTVWSGVVKSTAVAARAPAINVLTDVATVISSLTESLSDVQAGSRAKFNATVELGGVDEGRRLHATRLNLAANSDAESASTSSGPSARSVSVIATVATTAPFGPTICAPASTRAGCAEDIGRERRQPRLGLTPSGVGPARWNNAAECRQETMGDNATAAWRARDVEHRRRRVASADRIDGCAGAERVSTYQLVDAFGEHQVGDGVDGVG